MTNDPTKPEFYGLWSIRELQVECARLNQLNTEAIEIAEGKDNCVLCGNKIDQEDANVCSNCGLGKTLPY